MGRYIPNSEVLYLNPTATFVRKKSNHNYYDGEMSEDWQQLIDQPSHRRIRLAGTDYSNAENLLRPQLRHITGAMFDMDYEGYSVPITKGLRLRIEKDAMLDVDRQRIFCIISITDEEVEFASYPIDGEIRLEDGVSTSVRSIITFLELYKLLEILPYENPSPVIEVKRQPKWYWGFIDWLRNLLIVGGR